MLAIALVASTNSYASIGGKKKAKKKAKTEKKGHLRSKVVHEG